MALISLPTAEIPDTVKWSFWGGGLALFSGAVLWTILTTREYSPEQQAANQRMQELGAQHGSCAGKQELYRQHGVDRGRARRDAGGQPACLEEVLLLGALLATYGVISGIGIALVSRGAAPICCRASSAILPAYPTMKRLALVQFFEAWSALFIMWINTTPVVTQYVFGGTDTTSAAYGAGANWAERAVHGL